MPRLHQVARGESDAPIVEAMYDLLFGDRDPVTRPGTETGTRGDWWTTFANSPAILEHAVAGFALYQADERRLDPVLRELCQTRVGVAAGSRFVASQHRRALRDLGVGDERVAAIDDWNDADCFSPEERAVLAYADGLVLDLGAVSDAAFDDLRSFLDDVAILELTYIAALYLQHAVMSRALRTEQDDVATPQA